MNGWQFGVFIYPLVQLLLLFGVLNAIEMERMGKKAGWGMIGKSVLVSVGFCIVVAAVIEFGKFWWEFSLSLGGAG